MPSALRSIEDLDGDMHEIIREIDHLYDRVSKLSTKRHEPVRSLLAAAGMILAQDRKMLGDPESDELDPTTIQLVVIALHELGLKLKGYDL